MRVQVLISCMFDEDYSVVKRTNLQSDAVVVNQCDADSKNLLEFTNNKGEVCRIIYINTTERGLSRSRNMAIKNSEGDICLLCDDDEVLDDDYVEKITNVYNRYPNLDVIAFKLRNHDKKYPVHSLKIGYLGCARISSVQISFKKTKKISNCSFREDMGAGTGNGAGEENKFLIDLLKKKAKMRYFPIEIGMLLPQTKSSWFNGYTPKFHADRGWAARQIYGCFMGFVFLCYSVFFRMKSYDKDNSLFSIFKWTFKGFLEKR